MSSEVRIYSSNTEYITESEDQYIDKNLHRTCGPARVYPNNFYEWWINDEYLFVYYPDVDRYFIHTHEEVSEEQAFLLYLAAGGTEMWGPNEKPASCA